MPCHARVRTTLSKLHSCAGELHYRTCDIPPLQLVRIQFEKGTLPKPGGLRFGDGSNWVSHSRPRSSPNRFAFSSHLPHLPQTFLKNGVRKVRKARKGPSASRGVYKTPGEEGLLGPNRVFCIGTFLTSNLRKVPPSICPSIGT